MTDPSASVQVEFAGSTGEVMVLRGELEGNVVTLSEWSPDLCILAPGDQVGVKQVSGRYVFDGTLVKGPLLTATLHLDMSEPDSIALLASFEEYCPQEMIQHGEHSHLVVPAARRDELEEHAREVSEQVHLHLDFDDCELAPTLVPDSLYALSRLFSGLLHERIEAPSECGHLHAWHVLDAIDADFAGLDPSLVEGVDSGLERLLAGPGDDEFAPLSFRSLPAPLSRRVPVNLGSATLVDARAVEALADLAEEYVSVLDLEVRLSHGDGDHRPAGLWIEAVLGVGGAEGIPETTAFVDVPFDLHGSRLDLSDSAGLGVTMWATSLDGHDPSVLCVYVPEEDEEVRSPLQRALIDTHNRLRSALRDYALVQVVQERDRLMEHLFGDDEFDEDLDEDSEI